MASNHPLRKLSVVVKPHRNAWTPTVASTKVAVYSLPAFDATGTCEVVSESTIESGKNKLTGEVLLVSKLNPRFPRVLRAHPAAGMAATVASPEFMAFETENVEDLDFLKYSFLHPEMTELMKAAASGTSASHQRVQPANVLAMEVHWPSDEERREVASVLRALDDRIENLRATNETLEAIVQALFKSWFVDFDPVKAKAEGKAPVGLDVETAKLFPSAFEESELGLIPSGWNTATLPEVAELVRSRIRLEKDWADRPLLDLSRMPEKRLTPSEFGKGRELSSSIIEFKRGDCLFGSIRPYFHKVCVAPFDGVTNTSVFVLRAAPEDRAFVSMVIFSDTCVSHAVCYSEGTKMPTISWNNLGRYRFACPPPAVRAAYSDLTTPLLEALARNVEEALKLVEVRDALLPKLISGELRLPGFGDNAS